MRKLSVGLVAVVLGVAGCSTAPVVPDVANFGKTVSAIGSADAKSPRRSLYQVTPSISALLKNSRRPSGTSIPAAAAIVGGL